MNPSKMNPTLSGWCCRQKDEHSGADICVLREEEEGEEEVLKILILLLS